MEYKFESKRDLLYFKNYFALFKAIETVGGSGERVINSEFQKVLAILTNNGIELNPKIQEKVETSDRQPTSAMICSMQTKVERDKTVDDICDAIIEKYLNLKT